eukprot:EG_transcript_17271
MAPRPASGFAALLCGRGRATALLGPQTNCRAISFASVGGFAGGSLPPARLTRGGLRAVASRARAPAAPAPGVLVGLTDGPQQPALSLPGLLLLLQAHLSGTLAQHHDVEFIKQTLARWQPRREEYEKYIKWDAQNPKRYTRSAIYSCEAMDVLLMCWPAGCSSAIHCHGGSSCWVRAVEGVVHEVRYDRALLQAHKDNEAALPPTVSVLKDDGVTYINDALGVHSVQNRTAAPAFSLHVYAPGLRSFRTYTESGRWAWLTTGIE